MRRIKMRRKKMKNRGIEYLAGKFKETKAAVLDPSQSEKEPETEGEDVRKPRKKWPPEA